MNAALVVPVLLAGVMLWGIVLYNRLVTLRERFRNAFSQIDVQLRRRYDLIPNLVEAARGYMAHERETLEAVIRARNEALRADEAAAAVPGQALAIGTLLSAEALLQTRMQQFLGLVEGYPELRASQTMLQLQEALASTENRIAFARQAYNDSVQQFNANRGSIPTLWVANLLGFEPAAFFQLDSLEARAVPEVRLSPPESGAP
jgi:LemA protein